MKLKESDNDSGHPPRLEIYTVPRRVSCGSVPWFRSVASRKAVAFRWYLRSSRNSPFVFRTEPRISRLAALPLPQPSSFFSRSSCLASWYSHNSSFASDVTADTALSEGLTTVYRNDPHLGAMP